MPWADAETANSYREVTVWVPAGEVDPAMECLWELGAGGVWWEDGERTAAPYADEFGEVPVSGPPFVRAYFLDDAAWPERALKLRQMAAGHGWSFTLDKVRTEDWSESWKQYYHPLCIGQGYWVVPSWEAKSPAAPGHTLWLDPGMAFGTGTHPTTRACLETLLAWTGPGHSVLDVGSGSGILALFAALLGAGRVLAVEPDPVALAALAENLAKNPSLAVEVRPGTWDDIAAGERFDILCLNLVWDIIRPLLPRLHEHLAPAGRVVLSGCLVKDRAAIMHEVAGSGRWSVEAREDDDWLTLHLQSLVR